MKELIKLLQILRHSILGMDGVFRISEDILFHYRFTQRGSRLYIQYNKYTVYINHEMELFSSNNRVPVLNKVPYHCEDKNEFFQLSTTYDYDDMSYEDLLSLHELCNFMINRDLNERKR